MNSRLPEVGTTIFTVISALAQQHGAINLGQGFPDFDCASELIDDVHRAMREGFNQYPPMAGWPQLRMAIQQALLERYSVRVDPLEEITITAGATQALLTAILALVQAGDEVIVLDPSYDSYVPSIRLAGAVPIRVALDSDTFLPNFDAIRRAWSSKTRAIVVNSPHNPSGRMWQFEHWTELAELVDGTQTLVISDEVYEHMTYDGRRHHNPLELPALRDRTVSISSFGKTFHVTGWKVGYALASPALTKEFRKVHQFNVFTVNTPMQVGLERYLTRTHALRDLASFYQLKRDYFLSGLKQSRFVPLACEGTYFQCADYSTISDLDDQSFCEWLIREHGVAAIPLSVFYGRDPRRRLVRLCFAKKEATLQAALERLQRI